MTDAENKNRTKIAVIGGGEYVAAFHAAGADVLTAENKTDTINALTGAIASEKYGIIFITENLAWDVGEILEEYKVQAYPVIIPIPSPSGGGYAIKSIKKDVERAIGADILFKD